MTLTPVREAAGGPRDDAPDRVRARRRRWAELSRRTWDVDVEACSYATATTLPGGTPGSNFLSFVPSSPALSGFPVGICGHPVASGLALSGCFVARKDGVVVPPDFGDWTLGLYNGSRVFRVSIRPRDGVGATLSAGESFCFDALLPDQRLDLYSVWKGSVQGPFPPEGRRYDFPMTAVTFRRRLRLDPTTWDRPYPAERGQYEGEAYVVGSISVRFQPEIPLADAERVVESEGCLVSSSSLFDWSSFVYVRYPPDRTIEEAIQRFERFAEVESAHPYGSATLYD